MQGSSLGPYQINESLGAGGMGEVYRARDTKLNRDVAIKVLPAEVAADEQRLARFRREAQTLASLNHPNIGAIYGIEESGDTAALVLELIDGPTLEALLSPAPRPSAGSSESGPLPLEDTLDIALQIATALEAAHESGVVHRDLKPANIKVSEAAGGRRVKVLDFGLAKGFENAGDSESQANSPTLSLAATQAGMILGTAAYMSPEQARGKPVDKRADIWSFGVVLFEMLSGKRVFGGETVSDTLADVLRAEIPWADLPASTPSAVTGLLRRCLVRDPLKRLRDIGDARILVQETIDVRDDASASGGYGEAYGPASSGQRGDSATAGSPGAATAPSAATRLVPWAVAVVAVLVAGWSLSRGGAPTSSASSYARYSIALDANQRIAEDTRQPIAISPDGSKLAYIAGDDSERRVYLRERGQAKAVAIPETEGASMVFFSPDSQWLGFRRGGALRRLSLSGGGALGRLSPSGGGAVDIVPQSDAMGASWSDRDEVVFSPDWGSGLYRVSLDGGQAEPLTRLDRDGNEGSHMSPHVLPGGDALLFTVWESIETGRTKIGAAFIPSEEHHIVVEDGTGPRYHASSGSLLFVRGDTLMAAPFDAETLTVTGDPQPLLSGVRNNMSDLTVVYDVADDGTLVFQGGGVNTVTNELVWVSFTGEVTPATGDQRPFAEPEISPDGRRVGVTLELPLYEVWIYDLVSGTRAQLTTTSDNGSATWTPDGREVIFWSARATPYGVFRQAADGSGPATLVYHSDGDVGEMTISPDGSVVIVEESVGSSNIGLIVVDLMGDQEPYSFAAAAGDQSRPAFSPDGNWVAYQSSESGADEVYVKAYPGPGVSSLISASGGEAPRWSRDGERLFYRRGDRMFAVSVNTRNGLNAGRPEELFELPSVYLGFDVAVDREAFLMVRRIYDDAPEARRLEVALNWPRLLQREAR